MYRCTLCPSASWMMRARLDIKPTWSRTMTVVDWFGIGIVGGIALFFILHRLGVIDKMMKR